MAYKKILIVSDNTRILQFLIALIGEYNLEEGRSFRFVCGPNNTALGGKVIGSYTVEQFDVKQQYQQIINDHDLVISAHCKQLFPAELVKQCKCINIHPGLNPYNRGWFPQVFSILNGLPLGATIHEIDAEIDHGAIIAQKEVPLYAWDTSLSAYDRVQEAEEALLREKFQDILTGEYTTHVAEEEGNLNLKKDYNELLEIKRDETLTFGQAIDRLRALTHPPYRNAYFIDADSGEKVFVQIILEKDEGNAQPE